MKLGPTRRQPRSWLIFDVGQIRMHRLLLSPVNLATAACLATVVGGAIVRIADPELHLSRSVMRDWLNLVTIEAACVIPLFFLARKVRGARWLWLVWLVAALDFSKQDLTYVARSNYSYAALAIYLGWAVKGIVAIMLFVPRDLGNGCNAQEPNKAPEPTTMAVTPRATS